MRIRQAAIVLALALTSCDGPNAGELMFDLSTPNSDDGAIQFTTRPVDTQRRVRIWWTDASTW